MPATSVEIWSSFADTADHHRARVALERGSNEVTFAELKRRAVDTAGRLARLGVSPGSVLAVASPDPFVFVTLVLAATGSSVPVVLLAPAQGSNVLRTVLGELASRLVTDDAALAARAASAVGGIVEEADALYCVRGSAAAPSDGSLAVVKLSSGSTAAPKAIAVQAEAVLAEADTVTAALGLGPTRSTVCPVPIHHSYGFDLGVLPMLRHGTTLRIHAPLVPSRLLRQLAASPEDVVLGVPAVYTALLETPLDSPPDLSCNERLLSCTAPLPPALLERFHRRFGAAICQHYGSSEAGAVALHVPGEILRKPGSVGRPLPGVDVTIVDGEVTVAGPALAAGYLCGGPEPSPFRRGRLHTGDEGHLDAEGFLTVTGRRDAVINVGGLKVSPAEVARVLERHPHVCRAEVGCRSNGRGGDFVGATVAVRDDVTEAELIAYCRAELEDHKVPRRIEITTARPRPRSGTGRRR